MTTLNQITTEDEWPRQAGLFNDDEPGINVPHDGHCTRCGCCVSGDTAKITTKHGKRYCWDCFVDSGYARHCDYEYLFNDDDPIIQINMGEADMAWVNDTMAKMTEVNYEW